MGPPPQPRRRPDAAAPQPRPPPCPNATAPPTGAWAMLPPIQRVTSGPPLVAPSGPFLDGVPGHHPLPPIVEPLGHEIGPAAPAGLVAVHAVPRPSLTSQSPMPRPVQRSSAAAPAAAPDPWPSATETGDVPPVPSVGSATRADGRRRARPQARHRESRCHGHAVRPAAHAGAGDPGPGIRSGAPDRAPRDAGGIVRPAAAGGTLRHRRPAGKPVVRGVGGLPRPRRGLGAPLALDPAADAQPAATAGGPGAGHLVPPHRARRPARGHPADLGGPAAADPRRRPRSPSRPPPGREPMPSRRARQARRARQVRRRPQVEPRRPRVTRQRRRRCPPRACSPS